MGEKNFFIVSFTFLNVFLIFHSKNVHREVGRKVVMGPVWTEALRYSYAYEFHHCLLI